MNSSGVILEEYNYDPWGRRRNPVNWSYSNVSVPTYTGRGFTGHEHLDQFNLIHMNGRIYDPETARFLSPDPMIQDPYNLLCYNRYSYCLNNPLKYSDPTGYIFRRPEEPSPIIDWSCYNNYGYRTTPGGGGGGYHSYINSFGNNGYHSNGYYPTVVSYSDGITFNSLTNTYSYADGTPVPKEFLGGHYERVPFSALNVEKHLVNGVVVIETAQEITEIWVWDYFKKIPSGQGGAPNYLDNALKFEGAPYLSGGMTKDGIDCSGLVNRATGNETRVWTTSIGNPPGNWNKVPVRISSYDNFIADVIKGDLFLWPTRHTAFYAGDGGLFHAHGKPGTPTGYTYDLETWWIPNRGYPDVYRQ